MAKGKALQTLAGSYGTVQAGQEFELRDSDLKTLVAAGLAELVSEGDSEPEPVKEKSVRITTPKEKNTKAGPPAAETKDQTPTKD